MRTLGLLVTFLLGAAACGAPSASRGHPQATARRLTAACLDMIDALARAAVRCGSDYPTSYNYALADAAGGACDNVVRVRDEAALGGRCVTSLQTISCDDLEAGRLDASCSKQLVLVAGNGDR